MSSEPVTSQIIQRQMQETRGHLDQDVGTLLHNARLMIDWRRYVRDCPWIAVGAAVAAGFLMVPRRREPVNLDSQALAELVRQNRVVLQINGKPREKEGLADALVSMALSGATRAGIAWLSRQMGR